jgi:hypothetical protein
MSIGAVLTRPTEGSALGRFGIALELVAWVALALPCAGRAFAWRAGGAFQADSWCFFELSERLFTTPLKVTVVRQYQFSPHYDVSFPPLWPALIALINLIAHLGPIAGMLLNFTIVLATAAVGSRLFANIGVPRLGAPFVMIAALYFAPFFDEVVSGRAFPLTVFLTTLLLLVLVRDKALDWRRGMLIGLLLGALTMTRFDWLGPALVLPSLVASYANRNALKALAGMYAALGIVLLPWVLYSLAVFHRIFVSDNSTVAVSAKSMFVLDYVPHAVPTLASDPARWVSRVASNLTGTLQVLRDNLHFIGRPVELILICSLAAGVVVAMVDREPGAAIREIWQRIARAVWVRGWRRDRSGVLLAVLTAQAIFPSLVLGYDDARYMATTAVFGFGTLVGLSYCGSGVGSGRIVWQVGVTLSAMLIGLAVAGPTATVRGYRYALTTTASDTALSRCLPRGSTVMILGDGTFAARFGALEDAHVAMAPSNLKDLAPNDISRLEKDWDITRVYVSPGMDAVAAQSAITRLSRGRAPLTADPCFDGLFDV